MTDGYSISRGLWLAYIILSIPLTAFMLLRLVKTYIRAVKGRPQFTKADVVYQEWFASGCSQLRWWTKIGGGKNCVRLLVTPHFLWVTSWFPFSLLAPFYDLEHVIDLASIISVREVRHFGVRSLLLAFIDASGRRHELRLLPRNEEAFLRSIGGLKTPAF